VFVLNPRPPGPDLFTIARSCFVAAPMTHLKRQKLRLFPVRTDDRTNRRMAGIPQSHSEQSTSRPQARMRAHKGKLGEATAECNRRGDRLRAQGFSGLSRVVAGVTRACRLACGCS